MKLHVAISKLCFRRILIICLTIVISFIPCSTLDYYTLTRNILSLEYDYYTQSSNKSLLEAYKANDSYTLEHPFMMLNSMGNRTTGLYMYFCTDEPSSIEYTVSVDMAEISDYQNKLSLNPLNNQKVIQHEGIIIGLIPGMTNRILMRVYNEKDQLINEVEFLFHLCDSGVDPFI